MSTSLRIACIRVPRPPTAAPEAAEAAVLAGALLTAAPRVTPVRDHPLAFWADASGFERRGGDPATAQALLAAAREAGFDGARVGIACTCIAASAATRERGSAWRVVPPGRDASFLSRRSLEVLPMEEELRRTLRLLGLRTCGELARLAAADVELRFGAGGLEAWRLARGEDTRWPFRPPPHERASAEAEFEPPVATLEPLRFVLRGLIASVVAQTARRQRVPAALGLLLRLEGAPDVSCPVRPARPTAEERVLADLGRLALEGMGTLPARIAGIRLDELESDTARADQLDIFHPPAPDPAAVQSALGPLLTRWGEGALSRAVLHGAHLPAAHATWEARGQRGILELIGGQGNGGPPLPQQAELPQQTELPLCLRRFPEPRAVQITGNAQGRPVLLQVQNPPFADAAGPEPGHRTRVHAEGPERISGAWWGGEYAREHWLAEDEQGRLWLLFREARTGTWYLEGWFD